MAVSICSLELNGEIGAGLEGVMASEGATAEQATVILLRRALGMDPRLAGADRSHDVARAIWSRIRVFRRGSENWPAYLTLAKMREPGVYMVGISPKPPRRAKGAQLIALGERDAWAETPHGAITFDSVLRRVQGEPPIWVSKK